MPDLKNPTGTATRADLLLMFDIIYLAIAPDHLLKDRDYQERTRANLVRILNG